MKILAEGTRKVLLIDPEAISRNAERGLGNCQPVATVAVVDEAGNVLELHHGLNVVINGAVTFEYSQHAFLFVINRVPLRGAWITFAEVVIDGDVEATEAVPQEDPAPETPASAPRTPNRPARKTAVVTEEATP